ncbi:hypothetical protein KCP77_03205 [Salmonella enterica subsp. enterica]|nr:hypothetical protein KCP77_03205 [Salmonella enterica subsp. enterica]
MPMIDVILIILSVVPRGRIIFGGCGFTGQTGGKFGVANLRYITLLAPFICYIFTFMSERGMSFIALPPVISEALGFRHSTERPLSISVIGDRNRRSSPVLYLPPWRR